MALRLWHPGRKRFHQAEAWLTVDRPDFSEEVLVQVSLEVDGRDICPDAAEHGVTAEGLSILLTRAERDQAEFNAADEWRSNQ